MPRRELLTPAERAQLLSFPTEESELIRRYTLSRSERAYVRQHRGAQNRLGIAVQLCYLQHPGSRSARSRSARYLAMLSSSCCIRACSLRSVKFLSRLLTALNLLPSIATLASEKSFRPWHNTTNSRQTRRIAGPLSLRKSAIVLKSGDRRPVSQMSSTLRCVSRSSRRLDWIRFS